MTLVSTSGASFLSAPRVSTPFFFFGYRKDAPFFILSSTTFGYSSFLSRFGLQSQSHIQLCFCHLGGGTIKTTADQIDCNRTAIYARLPGRDAWIRLSPWQFLYPIPIQFFPPLAERYFGLIPSPHRILKVGVVTIDTRHKVGE